MSGIVKNIASITNYETKNYLDDTKVISIEKASKDDD